MVIKVVFDWSNPYWSESSEYNQLFLMARQNYYRDFLAVHDFLPLYTVLCDLGFTPTIGDLKYVWVADDIVNFGEDVNKWLPAKRRGRKKKKWTLTFDVREVEDVI